MISVTSMRRYVRLWSFLARRSMMAQLAYRGDFVMGVARNGAYVALTLIFYQVLFLRTGRIGGWSEPAVLLLFGTFRVVKGVLYFFVEDNITTIPTYVRSGEMDFVLLKPVSARFLLTCNRVNVGALFNTAVGLCLVVYGVGTLASTVSYGLLLAYAALILCAVVIFYNLLFILMTASFWLVKIDGLQYLFEELLNMAGLPVTIYRGALGFAFSFLVPLDIAATVPAGLLTGHTAPIFYVYTPAFLLGSSLFSQWIWRRGIAGYTSAGG